MKHVIIVAVLAACLGAGVQAQDGPRAAAVDLPDVPVSGDFTGDGSADVALFKPSAGGLWLIQTRPGFNVGNSTSGFFVWWGSPGDVPFAKDFDGDGKADITIYRPSTGVWWILKSSCQYQCYELRRVEVPR